MTAYTTIFSAPPNVGNFLVGDTMTCPVTSPVQNWIYCGVGIWAPTPTIIKHFPTWPANTGYLLASLVASSTASRTAGVVTVTATGHGVTTGTTYVGFRFYYPGSPSLVAGWYDSISTIPDANTITFSSNGPDFASESINGGAAWTTITDIISVIIPANTLRDQSRVSVWLARTGDITTTTKSNYITYGGSNVSFGLQTSSSSITYRMSFICSGANIQRGPQIIEGSGGASSFITAIKDMSVDQILAIRTSLSAAAAFSVIFGAHVEIIK